MRVVFLAAAAISFVATAPVSARDNNAWPSGPPKEFKTPQDCNDQGDWMVKKTLDAIACMPKDDNQIFSLVTDIYNKGNEFKKECIKVKCAEKWHRDCPGSPGKHFRPGAVSKQFHSPASEARIRLDEINKQFESPAIEKRIRADEVSKQFQSPASERRRTPDRKPGPKQGSSPATGEQTPRGPLKPCGTRSNPCKPAAGGSSGSAMDRLGGGGSAGAPSGGRQSGAASAAKSSAGGSASSATPAGGSAAPNIGINTISKPGVSMPNQSQSPGLR